MPAYNQSPQTQGGQAGITSRVWNAETPASGAGGASASQGVALPRKTSSGLYPFSVDIVFAGAPGAFEIDVQVADVDVDARYQTIQGGQINAVDAVNNTAHLDAPENTAKFVRLLNRTANANAQPQTAEITPC